MALGTLITDVEVASKELGECQDKLCSLEDLIGELGLDSRGFEPGQLQAIRKLFSQNLSVFSVGDADLDSPDIP